jgi:glycosyltransferase involved in cell wall biosynthesis
VKVAIVSGPRSSVPMGLELAELRLLGALRDAQTSIKLDVRVVGGRAARRHAKRVAGTWIPARPGRPWSAAWRRADLVHLIGLDLPPPPRTPFTVTVHDLSPLHYDDEGTLPPWMGEIVQRAELFLTPSNFTANELNTQLSIPHERIRVFGGAAALDVEGADPLSVTELRAFGIEPPVVLRYGGYTTRKNVPLLLEAWAQVPLGTLVLAGPAQAAREQQLAAAAEVERVVVLDYVPDSLLRRLLRTSSVLASPSVYEGFGLPALEAMAAGTPVVALRTPFTEEVCGDAAFLVEHRADEFAAAVHRLLTEPQFAKTMTRRGLDRASRFTWASAASTLLKAFASAGGRRIS